MIDYSINNFDSEFIEKSNIDEKYDKNAIKLIENTFLGLNFNFIYNYIIPFLKNNERFTSQNIYLIAKASLLDLSGFLLKEILKYPSFDINHFYEDSKSSFFVRAMSSNNTRAIEILLNFPELDLESAGLKHFLIHQIACSWHINFKMLKIIGSDPRIDINRIDKVNHVTAFALSCSKGNFYATQYLIDTFQLNDQEFYLIIYHTILGNHFYSVKIILKYLIQNKYKKPNNIIKKYRTDLINLDNDLDEHILKLKEIILELVGEKK